MRLVQELSTTNRECRAEHAINLLDIIDQEPDFLEFLLFSDEAHFEIHGQVNRHDFRYWSTERPNDFYREAPLHSPRLTVWAGIGKAGIVGPFFTQQTINGERYLNMLRDQV